MKEQREYEWVKTKKIKKMGTFENKMGTHVINEKMGILLKTEVKKWCIYVNFSFKNWIRTFRMSTQPCGWPLFVFRVLLFLILQLFLY